MEENYIKTPSFSFKLEETEYEEKDRIIENTIFTISLEIKLPPNCENKTIFLWRYFEATNMMIIENNNYISFRILGFSKNRLLIQIAM